MTAGRLNRSGLLDLGAMVVLLAAGLAGFWPVFAGPGFVPAAGVGLALGVAVAGLSAWRRWNTALTALAVVVAYFLGGAAGLPERAIGHVLPGLATLRGLVFGPVEVWRQFLTATTPLDSFAGLKLVPYLVGLLGGVTCLTAAWRARPAAWALLPAAVVFVGVIVLGTTEAFQPTAQSLVWLAVALVWLAWRRRTAQPQAAAESRAARRARWLGLALILAVAGGAGLAGPVLSGDQPRLAARSQVVPPLDLRAYASPLTWFRAYTDQQAETALFSVSGWPEGARLRLAVMDAFDGMVMNVSSQSRDARYDRVGPRLGRPGQTPADSQVEVTVESYRGVWAPGVSQLRTAEFAGPRAEALAAALYYNADADALVDPAGLTTGDSLTLGVALASVGPEQARDHAVDQTVDQPRPLQVPDAVTEMGSRLSGDARDGFEQVQNITAGLSQSGFFSHGLESQEASQPGHSSRRLADLLANPDRMVGDDEQYAVAACLMLRQLGLPARVVMGFWPDDQSQIRDGVWTVTGSDVHAWVEVPFVGLGWVPFDPVPDEDQEPMEETPQSHSEPKPQILQPPPPADEPEADEPENLPDDRRSEEDKPKAFDWRRVLAWAGAGAGALLLLAGPPLLIAALKRHRRQRRQRATDLSARLVGGWQELLDRAADLGTVVPAAATRREAGRLLAARHRRAEGLEALAARADRAVFAAAPPSSDEAGAYWEAVAGARQALGRSLSRRRRARAAWALVSLRRHPRPTVALEEVAV
ncbi:MAG: transglutaminase-like domain-containing protein [Propionibacteriaceae bacterium]|nr:transglutaminase-like domain-containing protein [Propionibacteriaceae bacterium]